MSSPRAEIFERLADQSEQFLSGWAKKEREGLSTFRRIWRLKELAYRPLEEFPDLAERFRQFEEWLGTEGMELSAAPLTQFQMEEVSAALEKLKQFLPHNGEGSEAGIPTDHLSALAEKFVSRLTGRGAALPTFSAETEYSFVINPPSEGSASPDSPPPAAPPQVSLDSPRLRSLDVARDEPEQAAREKPEPIGTGRDQPPPTGDLSEDFQKLLGYQLEYMREYRKPGEHPFSVIGRLLEALSARYHLADEVFIAHLLYFLQAQHYPVGPYLEKFRRVKSRVKK